MPQELKFCSQCGGKVEIRLVDERRRAVCTVCETIHYQNPLPVAAAIVLNSKREVLLVKRRNDPYRGEWCLPIGFAETGELIRTAARRELLEETGVEAIVLRLLDSDSYHSDMYGDLLIVTFEMEKSGGEEIAGDDAEQVEYFPIDKLPPLAFGSNEKALRICAELHRDEWAIQDSYGHLQAEDESGLLSDSLVALVRDSAAEVTQKWFSAVRSGPTTASYSSADAAKVYDRAFVALSHFSEWLRGRSAEGEIRDFYQALGRERKEQGFKLEEILSGLTLLRKHIWTHARSRGAWEKPIDVYRLLELNRRTVLFFDKAIYHATVGFGSQEDRG